MSRKTLVVAGIVGFVIITAGVILIFERKQSPASTETQSGKEVAISTLPNGWQLIASKPLGISVEVPPVWRVGHIDGNIEAIFGDGDNQELGTGAELIIYSYDNPSGLPPEEWIKKKGINNFSRITKNGLGGVSYETKVSEKYYSGGRPQSRFIEDTYILENIFSDKGKIIEATCALSGPNYKTMIPTCEEIVKSLQFAQ